MIDKDAEIARLRQALEDVTNPLEYLRRYAIRDGHELGGMAYVVANNLHFVQTIAREALTGVYT